jgi:hypothetical protein
MQWIVGGGQMVVGIVLIVLWWLALRFMQTDGTKTMSAIGFTAIPTLFLLWFVGAAILILHGVGLI